MRPNECWQALQRAAILNVAIAVAPVNVAMAAAPVKPTAVAPVDSTWVDHDGRPIARPPDWEPNFWGHQYREIVVEPLSQAFDIPDKILAGAHAMGAKTKREAVNANAFDEVPNSEWFTNRNHIRPVPVAEMREGPDSTLMPAKPWVIKHSKQEGASPGFTIEDAAGKKWLIKLDYKGFPQASSGADMVARTLLHAAGYNVPHNEPVRFTRGDLRIDEKLLHGTKSGSKIERFTDADLDSTLAKGAVLPDGQHIAIASLYLPGQPLGALSMRKKRPGDPNEWYTHPNRRELRGLYVIASWLGYWDTKDANFLDTYVSKGKEGHVRHYILDAGSSFGADADGQKRYTDNYESVVDYGWIAKRFLTLGFVVEPWRRAHQDTGIPSIGRFESDVFDPGSWTPGEPQVTFRAMTERDAYWGAKIVASFSDAQIEAAVDAAHYDDPHARDFLVKNLIQRRDKIARYWFHKVAPVDFFAVSGNCLRFHDLAVDLGLSNPRSYDVEVIPRGGWTHEHLRIDQPCLDLPDVPSHATATLVISVHGGSADPARVDLARLGGAWVVTGIRHA